jgi:hypothetical protein
LIGRSLFLLLVFCGLVIVGLIGEFVLAQGLLAPGGRFYPAPKGIVSARPERPTDRAAAAERLKLIQQFWSLHAKRDFQRAIATLRECMRLEPPDGGGICRYRYALALMRGEGVEQDNREALHILAPMGAGAAAELAELYARSIDGQRDPVIAAVYAWSATHDPYFGLCSAGCDDTELRSLAARLGAELSPTQLERVNQMIRERFSARVRQYELYDRLHWTIFAVMASVFVWVCWMTLHPGQTTGS